MASNADSPGQMAAANESRTGKFSPKKLVNLLRRGWEKLELDFPTVCRMMK